MKAGLSLLLAAVIGVNAANTVTVVRTTTRVETRTSTTTRTETRTSTSTRTETRVSTMTVVSTATLISTAVRVSYVTGNVPETVAQSKTPEVVAQTKTPEVVAQSNTPEVSAQANTPATSAQANAPETSAQTNVPATSAQTNAPATSAQTNAPATSAQTNAPQSSAHANNPEAPSRVNVPAPSFAIPAPGAGATLRFSCSQLVVERLDPIVNPDESPSTHLHQVVGGNAFNMTMNTLIHDIPSTATCTSCTPVEDLSNYWTAVLFFRARNGTYRRVKTFGNELGFSDANGGQTVYYLTTSKVRAFRPGFRMTVGDPTFRTAKQLNTTYKYMRYTCLDTPMTRSGATLDFPLKPCKAGIMVSIRFPTCWNGADVDSPNHQDHMAYPIKGNFEDRGKCPQTHQVLVPQVFYETYWDTREFNDKDLWPEDGSQPFVWSFGDETGYGIHGDYVFGWKGDSLQRAMDANCSSDLFSNKINCDTLQTQSVAEANMCTMEPAYKEDLDSWLTALPGAMGPM